MNRTADFESHTGTCVRCSEGFHRSGVDTCGCAQCETCGKVKGPNGFPARPDTLVDVVCNDCTDAEDPPLTDIEQFVLSHLAKHWDEEIHPDMPAEWVSSFVGERRGAANRLCRRGYAESARVLMGGYRVTRAGMDEHNQREDDNAH